jgi:putative FmdB family regulatory protein
MPLYAYACTHCGANFERQQKFDDKPVKRCPECGKNTVRRVIQPAGIIFKGSGWYKTDSQSSSSSTSSASSSKNKKTDSKSESSSASASTSDSKPAESKAAESKASESKPAASSKSDE